MASMINRSISYKKRGRRCGNELPMTLLCSRCALSPPEVIVSLRTALLLRHVSLPVRGRCSFVVLVVCKDGVSLMFSRRWKEHAGRGAPLPCISPGDHTEGPDCSGREP